MSEQYLEITLYGIKGNTQSSWVCKVAENVQVGA